MKTLASFAALSLAFHAAATPVDDVRDADTLNITSISFDFTITGAAELNDTISAPKLLNCITKQSGTLDLEIDLADLGAPFNAPITLTAVVDGDVIQWSGSTDVNQCVELTAGETTVNAQVRQVSVALAAQAIAMPPSAEPKCDETFNVELIGVVDPSLSFITFTAFVECIQLPFFQIQFATQNLMFTAESGAAPTPDLNGDGFVNGADLAALLAQWGTDGPADLTGDGVVNGADLANLLSNWGPVSPESP